MLINFIMPNYLKRKYYLDKIKNYFGKDIIKVIVGQRRVGKSYFILPKIPKNTEVAIIGLENK